MRLRKRMMREISVETTQSIRIRRTGEELSIWCAQCGDLTLALTLEEAALVAGVGVESMNRWIQVGRVHQLRQGSLRVCSRSLSSVDAGDQS